jgi:hypothetical protein
LLGPVIVTLSAMAVAKALHLLRMRRILKLGFGELLPWVSLGATSAMSAISVVPVLVARAVVTGPTAVVLFAETAAFGFTYLSLIFASGLIRPDERAAIGRWLRLATPIPLASGVSK